MKLYLSSFKIGNEPSKLKEMLPENARAAYISNPLDSAKPKSQKKIEESDMAELRSIGLKPEQIDLRAYFGKVEELRKRIKSLDLIYVSGGNVYDLRLAMKMSGLDEILKSLVSTNIVYGGYSAAVCVLSPTLKGYHIIDKTDNKTYGDHETIWEGLGLIDWQFAPHFDSDHSESADINEEIAYHEENNLPYKTLKDGDVIITEI